MYEITVGEGQAYKIPALDFRGSATGIDVLKVIETGIRPIINTGIAHKDPGVGQVGAGIVESAGGLLQKGTCGVRGSLGIRRAEDTVRKSP